MKKGIQVFVRDLLDAGLLNGENIDFTWMSLSDQINAPNPPRPDGKVIYSVKNPFKPTGGLRPRRQPIT